MDTQDIALMLVIGILVIALIVVNTAPVNQMQESVNIAQPTTTIHRAIPLRTSVTTMVSIYNPGAKTTTSVNVI